MPIKIVEFNELNVYSELKKIYSKAQEKSIINDLNFPTSHEPKWTGIFLFLDENKNVIGYCPYRLIKLKVLPFIKYTTMHPKVIVNESIERGNLLTEIVQSISKTSVAFISFEQAHLSFEPNISSYLTSTLKEKKIHIFSSKATLQLDLSPTLEEIKKSFKYRIRKHLNNAKTKGVRIEKSANDKDFSKLADIHEHMEATKGVKLHSRKQIIEYCKYASIESNGFVLTASIESKIVAFTIFLRDGNKMTSVIGASNPEFRDIPCTHLLLWEAIILSKETGVEIFDFGGIAMNINKSSQKSGINDFKYGFSDNKVIFDSEIHYVLNRSFHRLYIYYIKMKQLLFKS